MYFRKVLQNVWTVLAVTLLVAFVGTAQVSAQNKTYYVNGAIGVDTNDGSQMADGGGTVGAFKTIGQGILTAVDTDTIVILAGTYGENLAVAENLTFQVQVSGGNTKAIVNDITKTVAAKTMTVSGTGVLEVNTLKTLTLTAGVVNVVGNTFGFQSGAIVSRSAGSLTGTVPAFGANLTATYTGGASITAGNELPASIGTGVLTVSHTAGTLTVPNNLSVGKVSFTSTGNTTFSGTFAQTTNAADGIGSTAGGDTGTATFSSTVTMTGGFSSNAGSTMNFSMGATSVAGQNFLHAGSGTVTLASLDVNGKNLLNSNAGGTVTVTGALTLGSAATGTRINNDGTMTAGSVTAEVSDTAGNDADVTYTIDNAALALTVTGAITEYHLLDNGGTGAGDILDGFIAIINAANGKFSIGANSTLGGQINNAERSGAAAATNDGIILTNSASLTLNATGGIANLTSIGDVVGGTLVLAYANAPADATTGGTSVTAANNVTFTSAATANAAGAGALTIGGDLRLQEPTHAWNVVFNVTGTLFIEANAQTVTNAGAASFGGINAGTTTGATFAGAVTITGATATLSNSVVTGAYSATAGSTTISAGGSFGSSVVSKTFSASGAGTVTVATTFDINGDATVAAGTTLTLTAAGATSDVSGTLTVNGTMNVNGGVANLTVTTVVIHATTGLLNYAGASTLTMRGNFTGGTFTGAAAKIVLQTPSGGATFAPRPGIMFADLTVNGSLRTQTFSESVTVSGNVLIGTDAIVALGINSIVMTGATKTFTITDEATVTNTGTDGSVQFKGNTQKLKVAGTPTTNPTLQNITVTNGGATPLSIENNVNVNGTLFLVDGGITIATGVTLTFIGTAGAINRVFPNEGVAVAGTGALGGTWDLTLSGAGAAGAAAAGNTAAVEWPTSGVRNVTVSGTNIFSPAAARTITGNLSVSANAAQLTMQDNVTVPGSATFTGSGIITAAKTLSVAGVVTIANGESVSSTAATGTLALTGASQTHSLVGVVGANTTVKVSATGVVINGSTAAGDADGDSELMNVLVDANMDLTANTIQDINGTVTVNGTATLNLVSDGSTATDTDGQITGAVAVNNGGALTVSSNDATVAAFGATILVSDGGTFTAGSNLGSTGDVTVGNGTQTTAAMFNLNGKTFLFGGGAGALTPVASAAPATAPGFGTTGTANIVAGGQILGTTNPTIPNLTINGGAAVEISSDVTVTGTFTVIAASSGANGNDVTLSGSGAVGQFNANYTATIGAAGSQVITTGTTVQTAVGAVTITNLNVNSTSTTTLQRSTVGTANFTVAFLKHDAGVLDVTNETLTIVGDDNPVTIDWDFNGGSYANTGGGTIVITDAGNNQEIDLDTANATVSVPNLTVNGAASGIKIGPSDGLTVTGTLTLSGLVSTENGATDGTFTMANGSTIVRTTSGATNHFANAPTLGTGMTVRYTNTAANITTSAELPTTVALLAYDGDGGDFLILPDAVAITTDAIESSGKISIDDNDDGDNSITVTAGGTVTYDGDGADFVDTLAGVTDVDESFTAAGAITMAFKNATFTTTDKVWPDAVNGSTVTLTVVGSAGAGVNDAITLHQSKTVGSATIGDGTATVTNGSGTLATGAFTLTASTLNVQADGFVTGTVNVSGAITNTGSLTAAIFAQSNVTLTTVPGALTLNGTTAQTLTVPGGGMVLAAALTINNATGVTLAGGNLTTPAGAAGLTLTSGTFATGTNVLIITHGGSGAQGFTQTNGCVFGNVRKTLSATGGGSGTKVADRLQYPVCSSGGVSRTFAITFNDPGVINAAAPTVTVRHDVGGEAGVADLAGTNGLPQTANNVQVARYPTGPTFFWTVTPSFTLSPSTQYDLEVRGNNYANFSTSCGTAACDINEIFALSRAVGSNNNLFSVASTTIDNFLSAANSPVVISRGVTGGLRTSGTVITMGLKSIFAAATGAQTFATSTGNTHVMDLSTLFTGFTGALTYTSVTSGDAATAAVGTPAGNNLTITGGATAGSTTVTVVANDSFNTSATATFTVNNAAALSKVAVANKTLNVGGTSVVTFADVFSGGAGTVAFSAATSDAAVASVATTATAVTVTAAGTTGSPATITLTATDASSTPVTMTQTFTVSVNAVVTVANTLSNVSVEQGKTSTVDVSNVFTGGTIATAYTVTVASADATVASVTLTGTTATVTGVAAYAGTPTADTGAITFTVTGTDDLSASASTTFTVTVTPVKGDLTGTGGPSAFGAALALDQFLGLASPALTANQLAAADFDGDGDVDPFDAFLIWQAAQPPKSGKVDAFASASLRYGDVTRDGNIISIPVLVEGSLADVGSVSFNTVIDPEMASITGVDTDMNEGWLVKHTLAEDGTLRIAAAGLDQVSRDGIIAVITLEVADASAQFNVGGEGAVNNNPISAIEDVEVVELPETFALDGNYPNPFNPTTTIQFDLPETADVEIQVFDMIGRRVMVLPVQTIQAGAKRSLQLNATALASGSYFYRVIAKMETKTLIESGRMTLLK